MKNKKPNNKKRICIISFSNIGKDIRVLREIEMARTHFKVTVLGYGAWEPYDHVQYIQVPKTLRTKKYLFLYAAKLILGRIFPKIYNNLFWSKEEHKNTLAFLKEGDFDLVHANDWDSLPVAVKAKKNNLPKILFDAHEYSPEQGADKILGKMFLKPYRSYLFEQYLKSADKVITVSNGLQDLYFQHFGIKSDLIMNACVYKQFHFSSTGENKFSIIHHGDANRGRYIEEMIRMIALTDERFTLYLMLVERSDKKYVAYLKRFAQRKVPGRVVFVPPVAEAKVLDTVSTFDIGLPLLKASQKSYFNALPNKFFHYIMAGLAIVVPPLPAMAEIIIKEGVGCVAQSMEPEAVANLLNKLDSKKINDYKRHSLELAKRMNAEIEMKKLHRIYQELLVNKK
ncbi:MAG: glycosyltransferase [Anaerolineaceae bacterium]|nr:glycosyltransferase [Anaerolineaceae bacterium]